MGADPPAAVVRLLRQQDLPEPLKSMNARHLLRLAKAGELAPIVPVRLTERSEVLFSADEVVAFIRSRIAAAHGASQ